VIKLNRSHCWRSPVRWRLSRLLWCGVCSCTVSFRVLQRKKAGDHGDHTFCEMVLYGSGAMIYAMEKCATQRQLLRPHHFTHAQYLHEQAILLKHVPSASDHPFKNCRQKRPGSSIWITLQFILYTCRCRVFHINGKQRENVSNNSVHRGWILDSEDREYQYNSLTERDAVQCCKWLSAFWRNLRSLVTGHMIKAKQKFLSTRW
jgi:hypothetical protein